MIQLPAHFPVNFRSSAGPDRELHSPNDLNLITKIQYATSEDIAFILERLPKAQKEMRKLKAYERADILKKVASSIKENAPKLAWLISHEGGKPLKDAKAEVTRAQSTLELCAEEAMSIHGETVPMERTAAGVDHLSLLMRDPIGPVLAISAFNHPLNLIAHQVGCAIASGNPVVLKPAPGTPLSAFKLEKFFQDAGLPADCLFVVNCEVPQIEEMLASSVFGYVSFIGSAKVGWNIRKTLAAGTRLSLEHGGQAPALVREDADLKNAIPGLIKGSFYHAGQVCISTQRIFVHKTIFENFVSEFTKLAKKLVTGEATHENTDVGPLIRPAEVKRLQEWIDEALQMGAQLQCGNETKGAHHQFLLPTVLTNVPRGCRMMKDEAFGPVVCINSYEDEEEVLTYLNSNDYIFEAALYTQDIQKALKIAKDFSTMTLVINNHTAYRVDQMPFGGHKLSGLGMGGVKYMMEEMTRLKQVIIKI